MSLWVVLDSSGLLRFLSAVGLPLIDLTEAVDTFGNFKTQKKKSHKKMQKKPRNFEFQRLKDCAARTC